MVLLYISVDKYEFIAPVNKTGTSDIRTARKKTRITCFISEEMREGLFRSHLFSAKLFFDVFFIKYLNIKYKSRN